jgi:opacity protein-like surface antigen
MKTFLQSFTLVCVFMFCIQGAAHAATGFYLSPRFLYDSVIMDMDVYAGFADRYGTFRENRTERKTGDIFGGALAAGYDFYPGFDLPARVELEYSIFSRNRDGMSAPGRHPARPGDDAFFNLRQEFDIRTLFLNILYDFNPERPVSFYVGAGAGAAFIDSKVYASYDEAAHAASGATYWRGSGSAGSQRTNFAWNVGAGISWKLNESVTLDLGYRFAGLGPVINRTLMFPVYNGAGRPVAVAGCKGVEQYLFMHQIALGLRINF